MPDLAIGGAWRVNERSEAHCLGFIWAMTLGLIVKVKCRDIAANNLVKLSEFLSV